MAAIASAGITYQDGDDATSLNEFGSTWDVQTDDSIDEEMKKEVDNVMEKCKIVKKWPATSNISKHLELKYAHCLAEPIERSVASFLDSL